jgi:hypothetical protein
MGKSINKQLAEATAAGAADQARRDQQNREMQRIARELAERARRTK